MCYLFDYLELGFLAPVVVNPTIQEIECSIPAPHCHHIYLNTIRCGSQFHLILSDDVVPKCELNSINCLSRAFLKYFYRPSVLQLSLRLIISRANAKKFLTTMLLLSPRCFPLLKIVTYCRIRTEYDRRDVRKSYH